MTGADKTPVPLKIMLQPQNVVVLAGQPASFSVSATGIGPLSYQWFQNDTPVSGATQSTFSIAAAEVQQSVMVVSVTVTDVLQAATSARAALTVTPLTPALSVAPIVAKHFGDPVFPVSATSTSGGAVAYRVVSGPAALSGTAVLLTGVGAVVLEADQVASGNYAAASATVSFPVGVGTPALRMNSIGAKVFGDPVFVVNASSDSKGAVSYTVVSGPATIAGSQVSVTGAGTVVLAASQAADGNYGPATASTSFPVTLNVGISPILPANRTMGPGQQSFSASSSGGTTNVVKWTASGGSFTDGTWTSPNVAGTYMITATSGDDTGKSVSTTAVVSAPVFSAQPVGQSVCAGSPVSLSANAAYSAGYQWYLGSTPISGATNPTLSVSAAARSVNEGGYTVLASNPAGNVTSTVAIVGVGSQITSNPSDVAVLDAQKGTFSAAAQGMPPFSYQWYGKAQNGSAGVAIAGATTNSFTTPAVDRSLDGGQYYAVVTDSCGESLTSQPATLTVHSSPTITVQPALATVSAGSSPVLSVTAAGSPSLAYQWYWVPSGLHKGIAIAGATASSYTVPAKSTTVANQGDAYAVMVSNAYGTVKSQAAAMSVDMAAAGSSWVVGWGASPENAQPNGANPGGREQSFRSFFYPTVAGTMERIHLSNLFGTGPVTIGAARLALASSSNGITGRAVDPSYDAALTFHGSSTVTLLPGQEIVSDPLAINYAFGQKMVVSLYVQGSFPALTQHESQVTINYATPSGAGDATQDATGTAFSQSNTEWFLLTGMDVYGAYQGSVAVFGSSSIDGHASNYGNTNSYPVQNAPVPGQDNKRPSDWLAQQLTAAGYNVGVLNAGTIGDPAAPDPRTATGIAIAGTDRMAHDVLDQAGKESISRDELCKGFPDLAGAVK